MSTHGHRLLPALLAMVLTLAGLAWFPAAAATIKPQLSVRIDALSPSEFKPGSTVTMSGTVTNNNKVGWTNLQAYLVIARSPFTSRSQLDDAISSSTAYTGERVFDLKSIDIMGDLAPGQSRKFRVKVPYKLLGISGADGVYPVGVQILGTDADGNRSSDAIARATTFLPMLSAKPDKKVPASIGWPFLTTDYRGKDGKYVNTPKLLATVSPGGQLRNLLDLATSTSASGDRSTVIIDPALLVAVDDLAHRRNLRKSVQITGEQADIAAEFLDALLKLARSGSCWIVGYDRPDVLALAQNKDLSGPLMDAVGASTSAALDTYGITGRRAAWPATPGVTPAMLSLLRGPGDQPVIVSAKDTSGWSRRDGSLVQYQTEEGPVPLLVDDVIDEKVPGEASVVTLRQRIMSESALAVMLRAIDPNTKADAVDVVDPTWDPGTDWPAGKLPEAFESPWIAGASLDTMLTRPLGAFDGKFHTPARGAPLTRAQVSAAARISTEAELLGSILADGTGTQLRFDQDTASVVSVRWRQDRGIGLSIARSTASRAEKELARITIEGPQTVTLSSSSGKFPLTVSNNTGDPVGVGVRLKSSNPALTIPDVKPTTIDAGEHHTLTVMVDVGEQGSASVAAQLISPDGKPFGSPAVFNVRSSAVGAVLWVAIGLAAALVVVALVRRFAQRRGGSDPV
ncbi:MAG: DUF6049 family protein [Aeromicrobium sp.]